MNNPYHPFSETPSGHQVVPVQPSLSLMQESSMKASLSLPLKGGLGAVRAPKSKKTGEKKLGLFGKLFGGGKSSPKPRADDAKSVPPLSCDDAPFSLPRKPTESDVMIKRHEELIKSVDDICKSLEKAQPQKVELKVTDILPPIPAENIAALTRTQVQVTGVLEKVAGRLDEAGKRDGQMMDSLTRVDGSLSALSRASEKSVTTMDGMKGVFAKVSGSMEAVQSELKKSSRRYETLCEKVQKADQESAETIVKLQKRTLVVTGLLGIALVATLVIVSIGG
ncbi:MAG: hypothetical protein ACI9NQ_001023 [Paracoccaceae bacterium]|jgi:hypothetical protein